MRKFTGSLDPTGNPVAHGKLHCVLALSTLCSLKSLILFLSPHLSCFICPLLSETYVRPSMSFHNPFCLDHVVFSKSFISWWGHKSCHWHESELCSHKQTIPTFTAWRDICLGSSIEKVKTSSWEIYFFYFLLISEKIVQCGCVYTSESFLKAGLTFGGILSNFIAKHWMRHLILSKNCFWINM